MTAPFTHVVALGASAGGLQALEEFFDVLPADTGVPYVVVVHLSPDFKSLMPELLQKRTQMPVASVTGDTPLEPDHVYVIPRGKDLRVEGNVLKVVAQDRAPGHSIQLPIDIFFTSLADEVGDRAIGAILSGSGSDGSRGIRAIKEAGGLVLSQVPESAKFDGMPRSAAQTRLVDYMDTPTGLAATIARICDPALGPAEMAEDDEEAAVAHILHLIRTRLDSDQTYYRPAMVARRIRRRMSILGVREVQQYVQESCTDDAELRQLRDDLLIGVTEFFRDTEAFSAMRLKVIPQLVANASSNEGLRIWVSACSTGQEVYSIAVLIADAMVNAGRRFPVKIFATDVNEAGLERAARGVYSLSEVANVPMEFLARYFDHRGQEYVVKREIREMVIFAHHDIVRHAPFTKMDMACCRNFLIYLQPEVQERVLSALHFSLVPDQGVLFLGMAEDPGELVPVLEAIDGRYKLYRRRGNRAPRVRFERGVRHALHLSVPREKPVSPRTAYQSDILRSVLEVSFEHSLKSCALVSDDGRLEDILTDPGKFFKMPKGPPTSELHRILPRDLVTAFGAARSRLGSGDASAVYEVPRPDDKAVAVRAFRLDGGRGYDMIELEHLNKASTDSNVVRLDEGGSQRVAALEEELRRTRSSLQATLEELQSTNEEQQSTNEELVASNEELQSTNEELHSVNEELYTVNAEYHRKNQSLQVMTSDLDNLLSVTGVATLFLDGDLRVRRFNQVLNRIIKLVDHDVGRPITDFAHRLSEDFVPDILEVSRTGDTIEREVRDNAGLWLTMRVSTYNSESDGADGFILTFVDVTRLKNAEETARVVSRSLANVNESLAHQSDQLEEMFSIVAHDLRRPVMGLDGVLAMATDKAKSGDADAALSWLQRATETAHTLKRLLTDLSAVSQQTRLAMTLETVDLQPWFEELLDGFRERSGEVGAELNRVCDIGRVRFARAACGGVIVNLVENALIHGTSGTKPRIDVSCRVDSQVLRITVSDNGKGIAPEDHERIFELFRRLEPETAPGSGVGLVSARRLAGRAGGSLEVQSTLGQGTKFTLTVPVSSESSRGSGELHILVVEDNPGDIRLIETALPDVKITSAGTLEQAEHELAQVRFDCVLLDLSLPDGHGLHLTDRWTDLNRGTPVLILSGQTDGLQPEVLQQADVVGAVQKDALLGPEFRRRMKSVLGDWDA